MIVETVSLSDFHQAFHRMGREDQFSREGRELLFNYLEELSGDRGDSIELDVISLCCEFYESSAAEIVAENGADVDADDLDAVEEWLQEQTNVVGRVGDGFLYAAF